jgi:VCBS repeat-containing protein
MATIYWITGTSGDWSTAADWQSGVVPTSTDDAVINGSDDVTVDGAAVANSLTLNASELIVSGALTLGASLTIDGGSTLELSGGTVSAQSIVAGSGAQSQIEGYGAVSGAVSGYVDMIATGGALKVEGSLANELGAFWVDAGSALELSNGASSDIFFNGNLATLKLDAPAAFTGSIFDIVAGDILDLAGVAAVSASFNGSTLTVNETDGQQLSYSLRQASVGGDTLTVASDGDGGTDVFWSASVYPPPIAEPDRAHVQIAGTVTATAANGVLANDTDPIPNGALTVSAVDGEASNVGHALLGRYGTLTLNADGGFSYVADSSAPSNIIPQDIFTYTISDEAGGSATSTLTVTLSQPGQTYIAGTPGQPLTAGNGSVLLDGGRLQNETISAGNGRDGVIAGSNDTITLGNGNDVVKAREDETIDVGNGADAVTAGANSIINLGNGADTVTAISSLIRGGNGDDSFVYTGRFGQDTITNFAPQHDNIVLAHAMFANFAAVERDMRQVGANTVITYDTANVITLTDVKTSSLHASDFRFV